MPYYIRQDAPGCENKWAAVKSDGEVLGCHTTKQAAIDQALAVALNTDERYEGDWRNRENRKA
jgi:hypothetical protein